MGELPFFKKLVRTGGRFPVAPLDRLDPRGPWFKLLLGLGFCVLSPLVLMPVLAIPCIIKLLVLPCKILLGMDVGLTFEVR